MTLAENPIERKSGTSRDHGYATGHSNIHLSPIDSRLPSFAHEQKKIIVLLLCT